MCGEPLRTYRYRLHPPGSPAFERCAGLAWCSSCRTYRADVVHVPRAEALHDALAPLPADERDRLLRKETALVHHLDRSGEGDRTGRTVRAVRQGLRP
ncbi:hypothetical protein ACWERV_01265 [Streptomyces sp. NPDC004031]